MGNCFGESYGPRRTRFTHLFTLGASLSPVGLLRTRRAWCPLCYESRRAANLPVYEPLLWSFQIVSVCPVHGQPLDEICPLCAKVQYAFSGRSRPGMCWRCGEWLGRVNTAIKPAMSPALAASLRMAEEVGAMLAVNVQTLSSPAETILQDNLRTCVKRCGSGTYKRLEAASGCEMGGWLRLESLPQLSTLLKLCVSLRLPLARFISEVISLGDPAWDFAESLIARQQGQKMKSCPSRKLPPRHRKDIARALDESLASDPPPSLEEVASRLGYRTIETLRKFDPVRSRQLSAKWRKSLPPGKRRPPQLVQQALQDALDDKAPVTVRDVAATLGLRDHRRLHRRFAELCRAIDDKNRPSRNIDLARMESVLTQPLAQGQPPSVKEVAQQFGFQQATSAYRKFPDLAKELRMRQLAAMPSAARGPTVPEHAQFVSTRRSNRRTASTAPARWPRESPHIDHWYGGLSRSSGLLFAPAIKNTKENDERHRVLESEVLQIVAELREAGITPSQKLVRSKLNCSPLRSLECISYAISKALTALPTGSAQ